MVTSGKLEWPRAAEPDGRMILRLLRSFFGGALHVISVVPPNWQSATEDTLEVLGRKYNLDAVQRDLQGANTRFPAFRDEFWREMTRRLG
jgi:hypothetical protein